MSGYTVEEYEGSKFWRLNGKLHRVDGAAVEHAEGNKFWYLNDEFHRDDGPAVEYSDGIKRWYLNGIILSEEDFIKKAKKKKFTASEIVSLKSYGIEVG
jgi:hypothetical protein